MNIRLLLKIAFLSFSDTGLESRFAILFLPRTGSNFLAGKLDFHPEVICHHELFNPGEIHASLTIKNSEELSMEVPTTEMRDIDPASFIKNIYSQKFGASSIGFKISFVEFPEVFLGILLNRNIKNIILKRNNLLETFVSLKIADQTKEWIQFSNEKTNKSKKPVKVEINAVEFKKYARKVKIYHLLLKLISILIHKKIFEIEYSEISNDQTVRKLLDFIGVDSNVNLQEKTLRQNPNNLDEKIENYDELCTQLRGSVYETML